eukprot:943610-Pelagomonas_calceolata.AAC.2
MCRDKTWLVYWDHYAPVLLTLPEGSRESNFDSSFSVWLSMHAKQGCSRQYDSATSGAQVIYLDKQA